MKAVQLYVCPKARKKCKGCKGATPHRYSKSFLAENTCAACVPIKQAAQAYNEAAIKYFGEFAYFNTL